MVWTPDIFAPLLFLFIGIDSSFFSKVSFDPLWSFWNIIILLDDALFPKNLEKPNMWKSGQSKTEGVKAKLNQELLDYISNPSHRLLEIGK